MLPEITHNILQFLQEEAISQFPAFPEAFGQLKPAASPEPSDLFFLASDGECLFTNPSRLHQLFLADTAKLKKTYLHLHLHCLCLHIIQPDSADASDWDLACDLSVELLSDLLQKRSRTNLYQEAEALIRTVARNPAANHFEYDQILQQLKKNRWLTAPTILSLFAGIPELRTIAAACHYDSHIFWHRPAQDASGTALVSASCSGSSSGNEKTLHKLERIVHTWQQRLPELHPSSGTGRRGKNAGNIVEEAELRRRDTMDYHRFLRQFAVAREEAILDMDAFDYIPYYYGLSCYGTEIASYTGQNVSVRNIPFLEPLEYKEVNRLDEFAIAIDTSASCSGTIVRRFLEETWSILRQRENFFSKIRIHLIQCDSMIQDHQIFTSSEQLESAMENIKIHGLGNTDFRPVFEYLEKLIHNQEIRHLRGLLYFTDGDGIFPSHAPEWDTAFVFLNRETEKHAIPEWGIRLNLHIPDLEIAPIRDRI